MKRVFIAIGLSENIKGVLGDLLLELKRNYRGAPIRFIKADGFHITLYFLGNQDENSIQKIIALMKETVSQYKKVKFRLGDLGFFPNQIRPRVLWIGRKELNKYETLKNLQKDLGKRLQKLKIKVDKRPWHPHITLGRIRGRINSQAIQKIKIPEALWQIDSIELIESILKPEGPEYKIIHRTKLNYYKFDKTKPV